MNSNSWFDCEWMGHPVHFGRGAIYELERLNLNVYDICAMLPGSWDCSVSRRSSTTLEQCVRYKGEVLRIVVVSDVFRHENIDCFTVIHVKIAGRRYREPT